MKSLLVILFFAFLKKIDQFSNVKFTLQSDCQLLTSAKKIKIHKKLLFFNYDFQLNLFQCCKNAKKLSFY